MQNYILFEEYITLGQVIKELAIVNTGGQAAFSRWKWRQYFLKQGSWKSPWQKLRAGDVLEIPEFGLILTFVQASEEEIAEREEDKAEEERVKALVKKMNAQVKTQNPKSGQAKIPRR